MTDKPVALGVASIAAGLDPRLLPLTGGGAAPLDLFEAYEPAADSQPFAGSVERRGPGRPKGAVNKRTAEFRDYLLKRYGDPLTGLAEVAFTPIADIARELGCEKLEAARFWLACREALLPYVVAKMPAEVQVRTQALPTLVIGTINVGEHAAMEVTGEGVRAMSIAQPVQYQGLSGEPAEKSHAAKSHADE